MASIEANLPLATFLRAFLVALMPCEWFAFASRFSISLTSPSTIIFLTHRLRSLSVVSRTNLRLE